MAMKLRITRDDFLKGKLITPGWYTCKVTEVSQETSKKGDSQNFVVTCQILDEGSFKDCKVVKTFNEKAAGIAVPFFTAVNGGKEIAPDQEYDFEATRNRVVQVMVTNETYMNRLVNSVADFRAAQKQQ